MYRFFYFLLIIASFCSCSSYDSALADAENMNLPTKEVREARTMEAKLDYLRKLPKHSKDEYFLELPQINVVDPHGVAATQSGKWLLLNLYGNLKSQEFSMLLDSWAKIKYKTSVNKLDSLARAGLQHYANISGHNEHTRTMAREASIQIFGQAMLFKLMEATNKDAKWREMFQFYSSVLVQNKYASNPILWQKLFESRLLNISEEEKRQVAQRVVSNTSYYTNMKRLIDLSIHHTIDTDFRKKSIDTYPEAKALFEKEDAYNRALLAEYMPAHNYLVRLAGTGQVLE